MSDLRSRFREADRLPAPDLWRDIVTRQPRGPMRPSPWPRVAAAAVALAAAALGFLLLARAFLPRIEKGEEPTPTPTGAFRPEPKANGLIAFVRTDPESMLQEGGFPLSDLYTVEADGSGARRLVGEQGFLFRTATAWSADGSRIAFPWPGGIRVMNADGRGIERLTRCVEPECEGESDPSWSPDGSRIAFSRFDNDRSSLWTVASDGSGPKLLSELFVTIDAVAWSPRGQEIAVVGYVGPGPEVGPSSIHMVDPGSGAIVRTLGAPPGLELAGTLSWSPDGVLLAFDAHGEGGTPEGQGVYVMRAGGSDARLLTSCPRDGSHLCADQHPAWSPDGRQIAFTRALPEPGSDGFMGDLFVIDVASGDLRRLTEGPGLDCCPAWQPVPIA